MAERMHSFTMYTKDESVIDGIDTLTEEQGISESELLRNAVKTQIETELEN